MAQDVSSTFQLQILTFRAGLTNHTKTRTAFNKIIVKPILAPPKGAPRSPTESMLAGDQRIVKRILALPK